MYNIVYYGVYDSVYVDTGMGGTVELLQLSCESPYMRPLGELCLLLQRLNYRL